MNISDEQAREFWAKFAHEGVIPRTLDDAEYLARRKYRQMFIEKLYALVDGSPVAGVRVMCGGNNPMTSRLTRWLAIANLEWPPRQGPMKHVPVSAEQVAAFWQSVAIDGVAPKNLREAHKLQRDQFRRWFFRELAWLTDGRLRDAARFLGFGSWHVPAHSRIQEKLKVSGLKWNSEPRETLAEAAE